MLLKFKTLREKFRGKERVCKRNIILNIYNVFHIRRFYNNVTIVANVHIIINCEINKKIKLSKNDKNAILNN